MRLRSAHILAAAVAGTGSVLLVCGAALSTSQGVGQSSSASNPQSTIKIDYPLEGTMFPPEITAPTVLWHDSSQGATRWVIRIVFADKSSAIEVESAGEPLHSGELDPNAGPGLPLTPEQASTRTWKPDAETWAAIKRLSAKSPASIAILGFAARFEIAGINGQGHDFDLGRPVGAPIFYRDVPLLLPPPGEKGPIAPLPRSAIPLIKWQIRDIAQPKSHLVMTNLPTCANCHSFSRDGKTFGLDLDGPRNDKGLYALVPVSKQDDNPQLQCHPLEFLRAESRKPARQIRRSSVSDSCRRSRLTVATW